MKTAEVHAAPAWVDHEFWNVAGSSTNSVHDDESREGGEDTHDTDDT